MIPPAVHGPALAIFVLLVLLVSVLGFVAARWKAPDLHSLDEWGLGGRHFGILISWFLVGGDFYTAYTVIAIPALVYAVGAYGFFALPYAILIYPFIFLVMPRLWTVCQRHKYATAADFVHGRYGHLWLATAVALTGLLATIPYIALQMVGIQVVIAALGLGAGKLPLLIAFLLLAAYSYFSGLRAPAMIAFAKDIMIYTVILTAVIWIPHRLGGYGAVFAAAGKSFAARGGATGLTLQPAQMLPFGTMALGSALAAFMYPHTMTGILSSSSTRTIRWNAILLPAYTVLLGLIALLGYMAIAAGIHVASSTDVIPALFLKMFPDWFVGFSFATFVIGALVPAAIMAVGCANTFTRNVWEPLFARRPGASAESGVARVSSIGVLFAALAFVILLPTQYAIDLQLIGGIWILQIFPAVVGGLYRTKLRPAALLAGWLAGMTLGTWLTLAAGLKPVYTLAFHGHAATFYIGLAAFLLNAAVSAIGSLLGRGREAIAGEKVIDSISWELAEKGCHPEPVEGSDATSPGVGLDR